MDTPSQTLLHSINDKLMLIESLLSTFPEAQKSISPHTQELFEALDLLEEAYSLNQKVIP